MRTGLMVLLLSALVLVACAGDPAEVPAYPVASVSVAPDGRTLVAGHTMKLTAYPKAADGTLLGGRRVDWTTDAATVATVAANGTVQAIAPGTARISATVEGRVGNVQVTVVATPVEVATVEILNLPERLDIGGQVLLEAVLRAADGTVLGGRAITWHSSRGSVATVTPDPNNSFAVVSAHTAGAAVITAEAEGRSASLTLVVEPQLVPVGWITLDPSDGEVWVAGRRTWHATVMTPSGEPHPYPPALTWTVDDPSVASVDANGRVTGLLPGTTHVRATAGNRQGGALVTVRAVLAGRQLFALEADADPEGGPREVVLGTVIWYGDDPRGEPAREILRSGSLTLESVGGTTTYALRLYFDVVIGEGVGQRTVATGTISDDGTDGALPPAGDAPAFRFGSSSAQVEPFNGILAAEGRLILRQALGTAPMTDYLWTGL